jgi:hypothetical protein
MSPNLLNLQLIAGFFALFSLHQSELGGQAISTGEIRDWSAISEGSCV